VMAKIEQLIKDFCPNGVEYKTLGEIAVDIFRGSGIKRDEVTAEGVPCVRYGEIYTTYGVWFDECVSHTLIENVATPKYFEHGDILFAITGESVEDIAKSTAYVGYDQCLAGGDIVVLKHTQNPKYLAYVLSTTTAQMQKSKGKVKNKVVHSSVPAIKEIVVPIPPMQIQNEIVRILDGFAEYTTQLTEELMSEIVARKKQYEYYRDLLLSFNDSCLQSVNVERERERERRSDAVRWLSVESICEISRGKVISKDFIRENAGAYPVYSSQTENDGVLGLISEYAYDGEYLTWTTDGANAGTIFYRNGKFSITNVCGLLKPLSKDVNIRYLYFVLGITADKYVKRGMGNPKLMSNVMAKIKIPVPALAEQERIVTILDNYSMVYADTAKTLADEIEARKKQYIFYRDSLLNFKEIG